MDFFLNERFAVNNIRQKKNTVKRKNRSETQLENTLAQKYICPKIQLFENTVGSKCTCSKIRLPENLGDRKCTARKYICPKIQLAENKFARKFQ